MRSPPPIVLDHFKFDPGDELAREHAAVSGFVEGTVKDLARHEWYKDIDPKKLASGKIFDEAAPEQARRYVLAALVQVRFWDVQAARARASADDTYRHNAHLLPGWSDLWKRRRNAEAIISMLTRRSLPFVESDLISLLEWCNSEEHVSTYFAPLGNIVRAAQRFVGAEAPSAALGASLARFAAQLRSCNDKTGKRLATSVEQLCARAAANLPGESPAPVTPPVAAATRPVVPTPAGKSSVLRQLKQYAGLAAEHAPESEPRQVGLDRFTLHPDSPLVTEHEILSKLFEEVIGKTGYNDPDLAKSAAGEILKADELGRGRFLLAATERDTAGLLSRLDIFEHRVWQSQSAAAGVVNRLAQLPFQLDREGTFDFFLFVALRVSHWSRSTFQDATTRLIDQIERAFVDPPLAEGERFVLHLLRTSLVAGPPLGSPSEEIIRLTRLIGDGAHFFLVPGESWSEALNADLGAFPPLHQQHWLALLRHLLTASGARPSDKWLKTAAKLVSPIGEADFAAALERWLPLVSRGRTFRKTGAYHGDARTSADVIHEENAVVLRGMLWLIPTLPRKLQLLRHIVTVANSAYKKVPGVGPRAVKVGNAAIYALSQIGTPEAVGALAMLKVRVRFGTAQKEIEKAFNAAAKKLGMSREDIEELGVPTYGMEEVGLRRETFGDEFSAELRVEGRDVSIHWLRSDGKPQKSMPTAVKENHKEDLKEFQAAVKDIAAMLPAQSERLDSMFLLQKRWPFKAWQERYLHHPLVGTLSRRLVWSFTAGKKSQSGMWLDGKFFDALDKTINPPDDSEVELWHPIGRPLEEVLAWRAWLDRHRVRQPFKQAHREVYLLTDAERRTETYSNRFAAHILRQHQFNALCAARGWRNKLRLLVDDSYPPATRELPNWGLRAEFWIDGIGDNYGQDTNDSGAFLRVATDQVRFYRNGATANFAHAGGGGYVNAAASPGDANINTPLPLDQVPPLVLSEILRDVDLFVGVASVGNDPTWQDGGPEGRYRTYWHGYSFGELSATAQTRRAVLETLLPRLTNIRDRCSLSDRFLVVRGDLRTYKIHLGSGNILMEPNDQYLCIVPSRSDAGPTDVFLPFEGDATLAIILSKAFLLADDKKIKDPTITRQIAHA